MNIKIIIILLFCLSFCASCSRGKDQFIGTWHGVDEGFNIEFLENGTVKVLGKGLKLNGQYRFLTNERLEVEFEKLKSGIRMSGPRIVTITKGELSLSHPNGDVDRFRKWK